MRGHPLPDYPHDIIEMGTDSSGRPILLSRRVKLQFELAVEEANIPHRTVEIVQGAYMKGIGADASGTTHDRAGAFDTRTWDLTDNQIERLIRAGRRWGFYVWLRNEEHGGMEEHMHWGSIGEPGRTMALIIQGWAYRAGFDGLASRGRDYHWRPQKIRNFDYERYAKGETASVAFATYNLGNASYKRVVADLDEIRKTARVIGLQEAGDREREINEFLDHHPNWAVYLPTTGISGKGKVPILYRTDLFELKAVHSHLLVRRRRVVPKGTRKRGAGPATIANKFANHLTLVHRDTGIVVEFFNSHVLPSATRKGLSRGERRLRRAHFKQHVGRLKELIAKYPNGFVIQTGDYNATRTFDLLKPLRGLLGWTLGGTHGKRAIDHVFAAKRKGIRLLESKILNLSSDHHAVVVTYEFTTNI